MYSLHCLSTSERSKAIGTCDGGDGRGKGILSLGKVACKVCDK